MTLEQHRLDCVGSISCRFFSRNTVYNAVNVFPLPYNFVNNFFSLAYFIVGIQYIRHRTYKICVETLSVKLLVNGLKAGKFLGSQSYTWIMTRWGVSTS